MNTSAGNMSAETLVPEQLKAKSINVEKPTCEMAVLVIGGHHGIADTLCDAIVDANFKYLVMLVHPTGDKRQSHNDQSLTQVHHVPYTDITSLKRVLLEVVSEVGNFDAVIANPTWAVPQEPTRGPSWKDTIRTCLEFTAPDAVFIDINPDEAQQGPPDTFKTFRGEPHKIFAQFRTGYDGFLRHVSAENPHLNLCTLHIGPIACAGMGLYGLPAVNFIVSLISRPMRPQFQGAHVWPFLSEVKEGLWRKKVTKLQGIITVTFDMRGSCIADSILRF